MADMGVRLSGTNLERAADHNQRITLHAIRVHGIMTRVDIAQMTGLTAPAIANITKRLLQDGLIEEVGRLRHGRGQPATEYAVDRNACFAIGLNVDRDHLSIVLVNFLGETLARRALEIEFPRPVDVCEFYRSSVSSIIAEAGVDTKRILGIGVAIPDNLGQIDLPGRPGDYGEWDTANLGEMLAEPINLPVFVENDAAAAAMGEQQLGAGRHYSSLFYILISRGLGGGLVIDGNYVRGHQGRSGEIGFLRHRGSGAAGEAVQGKVSLSGLEQILRRHGLSLHDIEAETLSEAANAAVGEWIEEAADWLREPLEAVNCIINPAAILLSGRLPSQILERLADRLNLIMESGAGYLPAIAPVRRAMLSDDAPAVGAAILPFSHFLLPKAGALWKAS
ncbi:ROK family transcriptional regulator [Novosphingobium jiangmenense]|uniref:ROK family transcriptional regulator n=1 Tax=Novosphingobium jiangmenense TaxID=2791981 RepID=A0ABS0HIJ5_9SPHN|nr:ROK family transcriptional regulator [Novosphingobium jiangmenense]MBF9152077.1 ROK family transcriptional regulator [Novosphingobium jiangmenense]